MNFLYLDFKLYAVLVSIIGTGGRVPKGPKGAFKAQLWASGLNPPILVLKLMKSVFSNFRIYDIHISEFVLSFQLLVLN